MDQLVSACAVDGSALLIDCRSLETRAVPVPSDWTILIVQSGIERGLVDGEYNVRRAQCEAAAAHYGVRALRDIAAMPPSGNLDELSYRRARHVISENARTLAAATALQNGDLVQLGALMRASHDSMRDDFEISLPAVDRLQQILSDKIGGNGGARLTGGGFGGAVVAILPSDTAAEVERFVLAEYRTPAGNPPMIIAETPSAGASFL
jgi:galactokinase